MNVVTSCHSFRSSRMAVFGLEGLRGWVDRLELVHELLQPGSVHEPRHALLAFAAFAEQREELVS